MRRIIFALWVVISILGCTGYGLADDAWELVKDNDGIQLFVRDTADSAYLGYHCVTMLNGPLDVLLAMVSNTDNYPAWIPYCESSKTVDKDKNGVIFHMVSNLPWSASRRDAVLQSMTFTNWTSGVATHIIKAVDDIRVPKNENAVRMSFFRVTWVLEFIDTEHTRVNAYFEWNPEGHMSQEAIEYCAQNMMWQSMQNLELNLINHDYQEIADSSDFQDHFQILAQQSDHHLDFSR